MHLGGLSDSNAELFHAFLFRRWVALPGSSKRSKMHETEVLNQLFALKHDSRAFSACVCTSVSCSIMGFIVKRSILRRQFFLSFLIVQYGGVQ